MKRQRSRLSLLNDDPIIAGLLERRRQQDGIDNADSIEVLRALLKGEPGYTPVKGRDYFTEKEIKSIIKDATPVKFKDYFTEAEVDAIMRGVFAAVLKEVKDTLKDELTPVKGVDYFDGKTPIKGVDYFDGEPGLTPIKGKDYFDGKNADPADIPTLLEMLDGMNRTEKDALAKKLGAMIDISQIRNAQSFMYKGTKYNFAELMHGGGSSSSGGSSPLTQQVTAVQVGDDATINLNQLAQTVDYILFISLNGALLMPNGSSSIPVPSWSQSGSTVTVYNASADGLYLLQYVPA